MEQEAVYFGENDIIRSAFHKNKKPININEIDIEEMVFSHKKSYKKDSFKYFIGYRHKGNAFPSPSCVRLPQMNACAKHFDKNNKYINLLVNDKEIFKKYSETWNKVKSLIKNEFNSDPACHDNYIKTGIKIYNNKVYTNFKHNEIPKDNEYCGFLSVILLGSNFVNSDKEYYPQILLEECKYSMKTKNSKYN